MPVSITDGPLGLEATHTWEAGGIVLNDVEGPLPQIRVDRIDGLHSLPDADDNRAERTSRIGEVTYPSLARGKTVVYEGRVQTQTLQEMRQVTNAMRAAFAERSLEREMTIAPHPDYGTGAWTYMARVIGLDIDEVEEREPGDFPRFERGFELEVRMSDPRFYWDGAVVAGPDNPSVVASNQGTAPADPVLTLGYSGANTITITNTTLGRDLVLDELDPDNDDPTGTIVIDFARRTITRDIGDGPVGIEHLLADGDWWDQGVPGLNPGANTITRTGAGDLTVEFQHASW